MIKPTLCIQDSNGNLLFPADICAPYNIYRDNQNWGTFYFLPKKDLVDVIYEFKCVENTDDFGVTIQKNQFRIKENINEFNKLLTQIKTNNIRYQQITIEDISEPYKFNLSNMVLEITND